MQSCFLLASLGLVVFAAGAPVKKPHIVFFLVDDLGHAEVGFNRPKSSPYYDFVRTPNIDALAAEGVVLNRTYAHKFCSPTRCAVQSGRAPIHVNTINVGTSVANPEDPVGGAQGIPRNMTGMAEVMKAGGYSTLFYGKWDAGMATHDRTPHGRGYDNSINYFAHANDYWTFKNGGNGCDTSHYDLWQGGDFDKGAAEYVNGPDCNTTNQEPASGQRCVYEDEMFASRALEHIQAHNASQPLFLFFSSHTAHAPYEPPTAFLKNFTSFLNNTAMATYNSMVNFLDVKIGEIVGALKARDMWDDTLIVFMSDNGGPLPTANNGLLRGGKFSNFEGGIRVAAMASGGYLSSQRSPGVVNGLITAWDWYATFAHLAGVDPTDHRAAAAGLPAIDSHNVWPVLLGTNTTSPRSIVEIGSHTGEFSAQSPNCSTAVGGILRPPYKVLVGYGPNDTIVMSGWESFNSPNNSGPTHFRNMTQVCGRTPETGCLFDVYADPGEHNNLAPAMPTLWKSMYEELLATNATVYSPYRGGPSPLACEAAVKYGGFWGPFLDT